jgi:glutathione S-transferase
MKLYCFPVAPNPTKLRVYLAEKEIDVPEVLVSLPKGEQRHPEHLARDPLGRLPVLQLDDGSYLSESLAIIEYFEELHPDPPMIGREALERARVRSAERIAEMNAMNPIARYIHATHSPLGLPPSPEIAKASEHAMEEGLRVLDAMVGDRLFVAGEAPTIADCTLFAAFFFADFAKLTIPTSYANLTRWYAGFRERPSAAAASRRPPREG